MSLLLARQSNRLHGIRKTHLDGRGLDGFSLLGYCGAKWLIIDWPGILHFREYLQTVGIRGQTACVRACVFRVYFALILPLPLHDEIQSFPATL